MIIATTPRPTPLIKQLVKSDRLVLTTGSTSGSCSNRANSILAKKDLVKPCSAK
jgi:hypothetical protein